jgi:AcrR family transcriptional regulator
MRATAYESRRAIRQAASATFCERGYRTANLEQIGVLVGLTRGAVLHHFHSKAELLRAVVEPYLSALDALFGAARGWDAPTPAQRHTLLAELADVFLAHRDTLRLFANDVAARTALGLTEPFAVPTNRATVLLIGTGATDIGHVRVAASLGAMIQPCATAGLHLETDGLRSELIGAAEAVLNRPEKQPPVTPAAGARGRSPSVSAAVT